jgi:hypothetical protein
VVGVDLDGSRDSELERRRDDGMERWRVGSRPGNQVDGSAGRWWIERDEEGGGGGREELGLEENPCFSAGT